MNQSTAEAILACLERIEALLSSSGFSIAELSSNILNGVTFILILVILDRILRKGAMI